VLILLSLIQGSESRVHKPMNRPVWVAGVVVRLQRRVQGDYGVRIKLCYIARDN
jgi:hypothetical protein